MNKMYLTKSSQLQLVNIIGFLILSYIGLIMSGFFDNKPEISLIETYGQTMTYILIFLKILTFMNLPVACFNLAGCLFYILFPEEQKLEKESLKNRQCINFRVVTRGSYPELVRENVERNLRICEEFGLKKFVIEVVTDQPISLPHHPKLGEIVVPNNYETSRGTKFKARALHYALEPNVSKLGDEDWIVHLDEETIVTRSALIGILNFINNKNKHQIGQGLITYGKEDIVNWMTTLADSIRVGSDIGALRFSLKTFHKPFYSFKGSFIVCQTQVERAISFDNGLNGSISEDAYFASKAVGLGYTFDWIEGEMLEKSPFSYLDFLKQRRRWFQGLYLLVHDRHLKSSITKIGFIYVFYNWLLLPFQILNSFILMAYPCSFGSFDRFIGSMNGTILLYLFFVGAIKSFNYSSKGLSRIVFCLVGTWLVIPFSTYSDVMAVIWGMCSDKNQFFIVKKDEKKCKKKS